MKNEDLVLAGYRLASEEMPPTGTTVMIATLHYRCIGFMDQSKTWWDFRGEEPIDAVVAWAPVAEAF